MILKQLSFLPESRKENKRPRSIAEMRALRRTIASLACALMPQPKPDAKTVFCMDREYLSAALWADGFCLRQNRFPRGGSLGGTDGTRAGRGAIQAHRKGLPQFRLLQTKKRDSGFPESREG